MKYNTRQKKMDFVRVNHLNMTMAELMEEMKCAYMTVFLILRKLGVKAKPSEAKKERPKKDGRKSFERPKAEYTNTSPYGVAQAFLMEQLRLEKQI